MSSFVSSWAVSLSPTEVSAYQAKHPTARLTAMEQEEVTTEVTSYVDNPDLSSDVYDGFTPIIN